MEDHGYRHLVVDTNVLLTWLTPKAHVDSQVVHRAAAILNAVDNGWWPDIRLMTSSVCIAEAQSTLDKFRFCTWHKKGPPVKPRLTQSEHQRCSNRLNEIYKRQEFTCVETAPDIVSTAAVVSAINQKYQYRRRTAKSASRIRQPMGGADCLVVATAVIMKRRVHPSRVYLLTADQRMADVCRISRGLKKAQAEAIDLPRRCRAAGLTWKRDLLPQSLLLQNATGEELKAALSAWPLPAQRPRSVKGTESMSPAAQDFLVQLYADAKERTGLGIEKLPYTSVINQIRSDLACQHQYLLTNKQIFETLQRWRKKGEIDLAAKMRRRADAG